MRALRCNSYGPPESLVIEDVDDPVPGPGEVVVAVEAAAVNYPDVLIAADLYQVSVPVPFTPGSEYAGRVAAVGEGVSGLSVGDAVRGGGMWGAFQEKIAAPADTLSPVPPGMDMAAAAAFHVVYMTSYHTLRTVADCQPGEWVAVLGAGGGVGLAAVDIAKALGCKVVAAASSQAKLNACTDRGADAVVNYEEEDLKARIKAITGGGADVIVDPVGGRYSEEALRAGAWGCRFVTVGYASGEIPRIPLNLILLKGVVVKGFEARGFFANEGEAAGRDGAELAELFASGALRPYISAEYPLEEAATAMSEVSQRRSIGKVVIRPRADSAAHVAPA